MIKSKAINMIRNTRFIAVQLSLERHETIRLKLGLAFGLGRGPGVRRRRKTSIPSQSQDGFPAEDDLAKAHDLAFLQKKTWLAPVVR